MEKRTMERHAIAASIVCSHFTTATDRRVFGGKMLNYSDGGICIESSADFRQGSTVLVRVNGPCSHPGCPIPAEGFRTLALAKIQWCKHLDDTGKTFFGACMVT
jgi:hypothetical protein